MVQQQNSTMGEDRTSTCVEKKNYEVISSCRHRHSSVISSCSEDAESESTSAGYPSNPDEEREEELEYGPGIVNKLKTRYLSIALKQNRGTNMRRSCSMENLLDQDRSSKASSVDSRLAVNGIGNNIKNAPVPGNLKRAKSMDTLLMDLQSESSSVKELANGEGKKEPKVIRRLDGGLNRVIPIISDEELPKPDTVKTYKRMFEPAESRRGSYCRRPPVLRATAKASALAASKSNGIVLNQSAKVNGTSLKTKISAKQSTIVKAQSNGASVNGVNGIVKKPSAKEPTRPLYNGCHVVKHNPNKTMNGVRSNKDIEKELNNINSLISKRELVSPKADVITNGNSNHKESMNSNLPEKNTRVKDSLGIVNSKPQVPLNRPTLKPPKPPPKTVHLDSENKEILVKLKPTSVNGIAKISDQEKFESKIPVETFRIEGKFSPEVQHIDESKSSQVSKLKNGFLAKEKCKTKAEKSISLIKDDLKANKPVPEKKPEKACVIMNVNKIDNEKIETDKSTTDTKLGIKQIENENMISDSKKNGIVNTVNENSIVDSKKLISKKTVCENSSVEYKKFSPIKTETMDTPVKLEPKPAKKLTPSPSATSMVFDFRGKNVVAHVAVVPAPFGCKSLHPKKRSILIDGKMPANGNSTVSDEEDEDYVDYSVPPPSGIVFEGENIKIGRGSILFKRNKELKITFDEDVDGNTFVYPSESSLLEDVEKSFSSPSTSSQPSNIPPPTPPKLKNNTLIGTSVTGGGLSSYTPSVLRTMDNFEPGMFRPPPAPILPDKEEESRQEKEEEENKDFRTEDEELEMLKPADPDIISSWSISAGTSDLLF